MFPFRDNIPSRTTPFVTYALIAINVFVLFRMAGMSEEQDLTFTYQRAFVPARIAQLTDGKPLVIKREFEIEVQRGETHPVKYEVTLPPAPLEIIASLLFSMFMHGGFAHLFGNMWFLWLFGDNVEDRLGHGKFTVFYIAGGLAAAACHYFYDPHSVVPVVGASGAIAAVLGGYAVTWPHARIRTLFILFLIDIPAVLFLGGWFLLQVYQGLQPDHFDMHGGVAWWAHVGGFVAGALMMLVVDRSHHHEHVFGADDDPRPSRADYDY